MTITNPGARLTTDDALRKIEASKPVTKQDVLNMIPRFEIRPIFKRAHLDREYLVGFIGERGGGKSGSGAVTSVVDHMLEGKGVVSNTKIICSIEIEDGTARKYGLNSGGSAHYESEDLEKDALLKLDERYYNKALNIEEINVEYANVRRIMANTNVDFNEVAQQLRHHKMPLIYNVIDEMFIDPQLRALTDVFVKTYDTAFDIESLEARKQTGVDFHWRIYPMTGYLRGQQGKYEVTHKAIDPVYLHFEPWRGIYSTWKSQRKGIYTMSTKEKNAMLRAEMSTHLDDELANELDEWGWLADKAIALKKAGKTFLTPYELTQYIGIPITRELRTRLRAYGIHFENSAQGYIVESYSIEGGVRVAAPQ